MTSASLVPSSPGGNSRNENSTNSSRTDDLHKRLVVRRGGRRLCLTHQDLGGPRALTNLLYRSGCCLTRAGDRRGPTSLKRGPAGRPFGHLDRSRGPVSTEPQPTARSKGADPKVEQVTDQRSQDSGAARVAESVRRALLLVGPAEGGNERIDDATQDREATIGAAYTSTPQLPRGSD